MVFAASLGVLAVATLMLWGWGSAFQRVFRLERQTWPATAAVGIAVVVFAGGILNLARLAYPWALAAIVAMGVFLALREGISFEMPPILVVLTIGVVIVFTIATQLPPGMYNGHDDFQKYFAYPVRMLETGTVFGSPLSAMGTQTLGAQAFLDAFLVALFPIVYTNGVDAIFGLFLSMMLASRFGRKAAVVRRQRGVHRSAVCEYFDALLRQRVDYGDDRDLRSQRRGSDVCGVDRDEADLRSLRSDSPGGDRPQLPMGFADGTGDGGFFIAVGVAACAALPGWIASENPCSNAGRGDCPTRLVESVLICASRIRGFGGELHLADHRDRYLRGDLL